jgi:hypothetical protein
VTAPAIRLVANTYPIAVVSDGQSEPTTLLMHWTEEDPAAVIITMEDPWVTEDDNKVVEWVLGRALITFACLPQFRDIAIGEGDVQVRHRGETATISLRSPQGSCVLVMRAEVLTDFLKSVSALLPFGCEEESEIYARMIDADAAKLLGGVA